MRIKRLYIYLIKGYLGNFIATFCVCLFIVLMQFLWRYVDDMVGKGLSVSVLGHFFYYAALSLIPMALPLAVLLSSLMTFGNLGEKMELTAMKASGISLYRIMKPFVIFISFISIAGLIYSNYGLPYIQKQLYVLARSMSEKSPEVEIPVGSFYQGIPDISVYVREKDPDTKLLKDVMIYDFSGDAAGTSNGGSSMSDNISIICADSARLQTTTDKAAMVLTLYNGVSFENMRMMLNGEQKRTVNRNAIPYRRENFEFKQIVIDFDNSFKQLDASVISNKYVGKDLAQLTHVVDSLGIVSNEIGFRHAQIIVNETYFDRNGTLNRGQLDKLSDCSSFNAEVLLKQQNINRQKSILDDAKSQAFMISNEIDFFYGEKDYSVDRNARRHDIERHRKFTMSVACLLFFFIGAPLGAIIRKGGFGTPISISIFIFIIYYIVDNTGYKMAREGEWYVWMGIWLSSAILLPLGTYLTYKASTESTLNIDFKKLQKYLPKFLRKNNIDGDEQ